MAHVYNWQLGREMAYWYDGAAPREAVRAGLRHQQVHRLPDLHAGLQDHLDLGRGPGVHALEQRRDQAVRLLPVGWDVKLLDKLGRAGAGTATIYDGQDALRGRARRASACSAGARRARLRHPNVGEDDCTGVAGRGHVHPRHAAHDMWIFYLPRICNHCTYPACLAACPRQSIYKRPEDGIVLVDQGRCRGYQECVQGLPVQEDDLQPETARREKCIGCYPEDRAGAAAAVLDQLHRQDPPDGLHLARRSKADPRQPDRLPGPRTQGRAAALPAVRARAERLLHPAGPRPDRTSCARCSGRACRQAIETYRNAKDDPELLGLLMLFGSTERIMQHVRRPGWSRARLRRGGRGDRRRAAQGADHRPAARVRDRAERRAGDGLPAQHVRRR